MNCYNGERFLSDSIASVLAQSYRDWELIFWDNQSTDRSASIFTAYADARLRYFRAGVHTVLGSARNLAIEQARGTWIAFLDTDDLWYPEKLSKQMAIVGEENARLGFVYGRVDALFESGSSETAWGRRMLRTNVPHRLDVLPEGYVFDELMKRNFVPMLSAIVRRSACIDVGGFGAHLRQAEDFDLFAKISRKYSVRALDEACCVYRVHQDNLSHRQIDDNYTECMAVVATFLPDKAAQKGLQRWRTVYAVHLLRSGEVRAMMRVVLQGVDWRFVILRFVQAVQKLYKRAKNA